MKILLISPTVDAEKRTNRGLMMPQLALYILEGLTPPEHEVRIIEEEAEPIDFEQACDLVGIRSLGSTPIKKQLNRPQTSSPPAGLPFSAPRNRSPGINWQLENSFRQESSRSE